MRKYYELRDELGVVETRSKIYIKLSYSYASTRIIFAFGSFVMTFFTPDLETAATSVIATLANVGPGLSGVGATQNYASIPLAGQAFLTFLMLLGRLELYTVLILFLPSFWKR